MLVRAQAPNQDALCFRDELDEWAERYHCRVVTSTRDSFQDMFDDDDTLAYEPASTAAVILTGGDAEAEAAALAVRWGAFCSVPLPAHCSCAAACEMMTCVGFTTAPRLV